MSEVDLDPEFDDVDDELNSHRDLVISRTIPYLVRQLTVFCVVSPYGIDHVRV